MRDEMTDIARGLVQSGKKLDAHHASIRRLMMKSTERSGTFNESLHPLSDNNPGRHHVKRVWTKIHVYRASVNAPINRYAYNQQNNTICRYGYWTLDLNI